VHLIVLLVCRVFLVIKRDQDLAGAPKLCMHWLVHTAAGIEKVHEDAFEATLQVQYFTPEVGASLVFYLYSTSKENLNP